MQYLKMPKKIPDYRAERNHLDFLGKVSTYIGNVQEFYSSLRLSLNSRFEIVEYDVNALAEDVEKILRDKQSNNEIESVTTIDSLAKTVVIDKNFELKKKTNFIR